METHCPARCALLTAVLKLVLRWYGFFGINPFSSIFLRNSLKDSPAWIALRAACLS